MPPPPPADPTPPAAASPGLLPAQAPTPGDLPGSAGFRVNLSELDKLAADLCECTDRLDRSLAELSDLGAPSTGHPELDATCARLLEAWQGRLASLAGVVRDYHERVIATRGTYAEADAAVARMLLHPGDARDQAAGTPS